MLSLFSKSRVKIALFVTLSFVLGGVSVFSVKHLKHHYSLKKMENREKKKPRPYDYAFGVFDSVGLYQKNGRIENYGLDIDQPQVGPIRVDGAEFHIKNDKNIFVWFPENLTIEKDFIPEIEGKGLDNQPLIIGLVTKQETYLFHNTKKTLKEDILPENIPDDIKTFFKKIKKVSTLDLQKNGMTLRGKPFLKKVLASHADNTHAIEAIFLMIPGASQKQVSLKRFCFLQNMSLEGEQKTLSKHRIVGRIEGDRLPLGEFVTLRMENNTEQKVFLNLDQTFVFDRPKDNQPLSIMYRYKERDYYTQFGRWIDTKTPLNHVVISLKPSYLNATGAFSDPKIHKFTGAGSPQPQDNVYAAHSRQYWNGLNAIQCYQGLPFTNNMGYLDRDRFAQKKKGHLRILHIGGSTAVSLQVKPYEKYNILLEQELGLLLQRPVEVISIGRDNGDIGTHYKRFSFFVEHFKPDLVLFENMTGLMMQIQPDLLKRGHGFDFDKNIFPHFTYDEKGDLAFVEENQEYGLYTQAPNTEELTKGVPLWDSLKVPFAHMHPSALEAYQYLKDIFFLYQKKFPHQRIALHTGVDQAQCMQPCKMSKTPEGIPYGMKIFLQNIDQFCKDHGILNFNPSLGDQLNHPHTKLTFEHDGHYSPRGHQWISKELAALLKPYILAQGL